MFGTKKSILTVLGAGRSWPSSQDLESEWGVYKANKNGYKLLKNLDSRGAKGVIANYKLAFETPFVPRELRGSTKETSSNLEVHRFPSNLYLNTLSWLSVRLLCAPEKWWHKDPFHIFDCAIQTLMNHVKEDTRYSHHAEIITVFPTHTKIFWIYS